MSKPPPRLEIRNLTRIFGGVRAVDDVSLTVEAGQIICLLGPSGCGKSTTLRLIAGVDRQDAGAVSVDGTLVSQDTVHLPPEARGIGLMFQDFALFPHLTVRKNVAFGLSGSRASKDARVRDLLQKVGLERHIDAYPHELSGGEQQRVALTRALAPRPKVMLMDEPFSGLDNRLRDGVRDEALGLLKEEGTAVLLITHEPEEAMRMADEIALMRAGRIVQLGAPQTLFTEPVDKDAVAFFSDINVVPGRVRAGHVETIFGRFPAQGEEDGDRMDVIVRPNDIVIEPDKPGGAPKDSDVYGRACRALVTRSRYMGGFSLIEFALEEEDITLQVNLANVYPPPARKAFWLMLPRDRCFVFPQS